MSERPLIQRQMRVRMLVQILKAGRIQDRLGISNQAISNWRVHGCIPPARYLDLKALGDELGIEVDPELFKEHVDGCW